MGLPRTSCIKSQEHPSLEARLKELDDLHAREPITNEGDRGVARAVIDDHTLETTLEKRDVVQRLNALEAIVTDGKFELTRKIDGLS